MVCPNDGFEHSYTLPQHTVCQGGERKVKKDIDHSHPRHPNQYGSDHFRVDTRVRRNQQLAYEPLPSTQVCDR